MEVCGHDGVERAGILRHPHRHRIDQHPVPGHVREVLRDLGGDLVPEHHAVVLRVRLGHHGERLARPRPCEREGVARDALDAGAGEDRDFGGGLVALGAMAAPALAGIFPRGVFPHDHPVQIPGTNPCERALDARQDPCGTHVGVLVERLADGEAQAPERQVVRHVRRAPTAPKKIASNARSRSTPSSGLKALSRRYRSDPQSKRGRVFFPSTASRSRNANGQGLFRVLKFSPPGSRA